MLRARHRNLDELRDMPIDRGILDQQLQDIGEASRWWNQREIRDLPAVLHENEKIVAMSRGRVARIRWLRRKWLIVVTEDRLLCLRSAPGKGWRQIEAPANNITRVFLRIGPFKGRVLVVADGQYFKLLVPRADAYRLHSALIKLGPTGSETLAGFGPTRIVRSMVDHVLALPAAAFAPAGQLAAPPANAVSPDNTAMMQRMQLLEEQVNRLTDQVRFLEELLRQRSA
jgi:hypothetical protein